MKKNNLPAIGIWTVYALVSGCFLFLTALNLGGKAGYSSAMGLVAGIVVLLLLCGGVFLLNFLANKHLNSVNARKIRYSKNSYLVSLAVEGVIAAGLVILMIFVRTGYSADAYPWYIPASAEYRMAQVGADIPVIAHKGRELYVWLLRGFCYLLGNQPQTVVVFQLILLVIATVCLYFGIRKNAGEIAALIVLAFMSFAPYMIAETCRSSAFLLVMIFYGIALRCISGLAERRKLNTVWRGLYYAVTGLVIGICCYLDMAGITLLIFLTGELCFAREEARDTDADSPLSAFGCCLLFSVLFYFLCHAVRGAVGGTMADSIKAQLSLCAPQRFLLPIGAWKMVSWDMAVLAILMAAGIFSFWFDHRIRTRGIWLFAAILLLVMQAFQMESTEYFNPFALLYFMCAAMAGIGVEYLRLWMHKVHGSQEKGRTVFGEDTDFDMQQIEKPEELEVEILDQKENESNNGLDFKYIENPLPVPKKRERKIMEYDYEVADDDDFDIP